MKTILTEERVQVERLIEEFIEEFIDYANHIFEVNENVTMSDIYEVLVSETDGTFIEFNDKENELFKKYHSHFKQALTRIL